jgi:hypothetical protein
MTVQPLIVSMSATLSKAMIPAGCEHAEETRDLLRHKNSNMTRAVDRAHVGHRRRERAAGKKCVTSRKRA